MTHEIGEDGRDTSSGELDTGNVSIVVAGEAQEVRPLDPATVLIVVAGWAASGVVGTAAWELLKIPYMKVRQGTKVEGDSLDDAERWLLAKLAIQARCGELGWPVPELGSMKELTHEADADWHRLRLEAPSLEGEVSLPRGKLAETRILVRLRRPRDE